jgi:hypothetical protein
MAKNNRIFAPTYLRTSSATAVGTENDSQRMGIEAFAEKQGYP